MITTIPKPYVVELNDEIYSMDPDGLEQTRLTSNPKGDYFPAVSPDGKKIAFMSDRDGNYEMYVMNANGSDQRHLSKNTANQRPK